jgi:NAD(P)-dependent dehydrogenase (short-subunit alcohol dehydrogenase family)
MWTEEPSANQKWSPPDLRETVACVTGASYGVGRGIAEVLGECGATVYVTARSTRAKPSRDHHWSAEETAELVTNNGGTGVPIKVDHSKDAQVQRLFDRIKRDYGRLDLLINNVWQWGPQEAYLAPTWNQPIARWDAMVGVGVRAHFVATRLGLPLMLGAGRGLIVFTQERPGDAKHYCQNAVVDVAAAAQQRLVRYLAHELRAHKIAVALVYLGWVRSVNMGLAFDADLDPKILGMSKREFLRRTQSPYLIGRAIAMLAADGQVMGRSGRTLYAGDLARAYDFTDIDGRVPLYEGGE